MGTYDTATGVVYGQNPDTDDPTWLLLAEGEPIIKFDSNGAAIYSNGASVMSFSPSGVAEILGQLQVSGEIELVTGKVFGRESEEELAWQLDQDGLTLFGLGQPNQVWFYTNDGTYLLRQDGIELPFNVAPDYDDRDVVNGFSGVYAQEVGAFYRTVATTGGDPREARVELYAEEASKSRIRWKLHNGTSLSTYLELLHDGSPSATLYAPLSVSDANGIDVNPGSDIDVDLITVGVDGTPTFWWDESADRFELSHGLQITGGRLGVGTNNPSHPIHLYDSGVTFFRIESAGAYNSGFRIDNASGSWLFYNTGSNQFNFRDLSNAINVFTANPQTLASTTAILVDNWGRVAIGRGATSTAALDIVGSTTSAASLRIRSGAAPTSPNQGEIWAVGGDLYFYDGSTIRQFAWV